MKVLVTYVMNQAVNSPTGVEWPQVVENTPANVELVNTIIQDCRVTTAGVTLTRRNFWDRRPSRCSLPCHGR